MKGKRLAVVVSQDGRESATAVERSLGRSGLVVDGAGREADGLVSELAADGYDVIGVLGGDGAVAQIAEATTGLSGARPLVLPLLGQGSSLMADLKASGRPEELAARFASLSERGRRRFRSGPRTETRRLLRVSDSRRPRVAPAFSVGVGKLLSSVASGGSRVRKAGRLARWLLEDLRPGVGALDGVRISVDGEVLEGGTVLALVSTLSALPVGSFKAGPSELEGFNLLWLGTGLARSAMAMASLSSTGADAARQSRASRVDMDLEVPVVLDGVVVGASQAYALSVRPGNSVDFLVL